MLILLLSWLTHSEEVLTSSFLIKPSNKTEDFMSFMPFCHTMNLKKCRSRVEQPVNLMQGPMIASSVKIYSKSLVWKTQTSPKTLIQKPFITFCSRLEKIRSINYLKLPLNCWISLTKNMKKWSKFSPNNLWIKRIWLNTFQGSTYILKLEN